MKMERIPVNFLKVYFFIQGNPVVAHLGNDIYVKASVNSNDPSVRMRLDTCVTKPSTDTGPRYTYTLIQNG